MVWKPILLALLSLAILGCGSDDSFVPPGDLDLTGDWFRVVEPDCHGSFSLEHSPLRREQEFIDAEWLRIEQHDNTISLSVEGEFGFGGIEIVKNDGIITFGSDFGVDVSYPADLDEDGLYYTQANVYRRGHLDDRMRLVFQDRYEAKLLFPDRHGADEHDLFCTHVFERER